MIEQIKKFVNKWIVDEDRCIPTFMTPLDLRDFLEEWEKVRKMEINDGD